MFLPAIGQGIYFLLTGIWALVSIDTFQKVTGPKIDLWLVKTVGVIVSVIGAVLISAGLRGSITFEIVLLAVGSSLALAGIDVYYSFKNVISKIYLADAVIELVLIGFWLTSY